MKNVKRKVLFLAASLAFTGALSAGALAANVTAKAEGWDDLTLTMTKGASARLSEESGLRFKATLKNYDETDGVTYGMVIVPVDYLTDMTFDNDYVEKLNAEYGAGNYINAQVLPTEEDGNTIIQHSITSIKTGNYDREFFGIAYATDGTTYKYATPNDNERSITYIASCALNDVKYTPDVLDDATKSLYENNETLLTEFVETGISNAGGITPTLSGESNLYTGDIKELSLSGADKVELEWIWSSENEEVATASAGSVAAIKAGSANVSVKCAGLYEETLAVNVTNEAGVVAPFNRAGAANYAVAHKSTINASQAHTYGDEAYSLHVAATGGQPAIFLKGSELTITNLDAVDDNGNYLYNFISVQIYLNTNVTSSVHFHSTTNEANSTTLTYGEWKELKAVRNEEGKFICVGSNGVSYDIFGGTAPNSTTYSNAASTSATNIDGLRIRFTNAYDEDNKLDVFISAVRVGYEETDPVEPDTATDVVLAPFDTDKAADYVVAHNFANSVAASAKQTYLDEAYSLRCEATTSTGSAIFLKGSELTITNLNAVDDNGKYLYNSISTHIYLATNTTLGVHFHSTSNESNSTALTYGEWTELKAVRNEEGKFICVGSNGESYDIFGGTAPNSNTYPDAANTTATNIDGLRIRFTNNKTSIIVYFSAVRLGLNPDATQSGTGDS